MNRFKSFITEAKATTRVSMEHLEKMKPEHFFDLMKMFKKDLKGIISNQSVGISEKVDGFGFRFGIHDNKFYVETSRSGPQFSLGAFSQHNIKRTGTATEISLHFDALHKTLLSNRKLQSLLRSIHGLEGNFKVIGEGLYMPLGVEQSNGRLKFVEVEYDKAKLGSIFTFVVFDIVTDDGRSLFNKYMPMFSRSSDKEVKYLTPDLNGKFSVDVNLEVSAFFNTFTNEKEIKRVLSSRKHADRPQKERLKELISKFQVKIAHKILNGIQHGLLGPKFEGIVIKFATGRTVKITTKEFQATKKK